MAGQIIIAVVNFLFIGFFALGASGSGGAAFIVAAISTGMVCLVGHLAKARGRDAVPWMIYGFLLWPIALIHVLLVSKDRAAVERNAIAEGELRKCPECAELIKAEARRCRYCGSAVEPLHSPLVTPPAQDVVL